MTARIPPHFRWSRVVHGILAVGVILIVGLGVLDVALPWLTTSGWLAAVEAGTWQLTW